MRVLGALVTVARAEVAVAATITTTITTTVALTTQGEAATKVSIMRVSWEPLQQLCRPTRALSKASC